MLKTPLIFQAFKSARCPSVLPGFMLCGRIDTGANQSCNTSNTMSTVTNEFSARYYISRHVCALATNPTEQAYASYATSNMVFETGTLRFGYQSMVSPRSVYDYDMDTK